MGSFGSCTRFSITVPLEELVDYEEEDSELEADDGDDNSDEEEEEEERIMVKPGPNRPTIVSFLFVGTMDNYERFNDLLYNLNHLVDLNLDCEDYSQEVKNNNVNLERLLESMPHLVYLSICGCDYEGIHLENSKLLRWDLPPYRLQSFTFETNLIDMHKKDHFRIFQRLRGLTSIHIRGYAMYVDGFLKRYMPRGLTWTLEQCCPRLQDFQVYGIIPLELYRLVTPTSISAGVQWLDHDLTSGGQGSLLPPPRLFSNLSTFESKLGPMISSADLSYIQNHCRFLTRVVIDSRFRVDENLDITMAAESLDWYPPPRLLSTSLSQNGEDAALPR